MGSEFSWWHSNFFPFFVRAKGNSIVFRVKQRPAESLLLTLHMFSLFSKPPQPPDSFPLASTAWKSGNTHLLCGDLRAFIRMWEGSHINPLSLLWELTSHAAFSHLCRTWGTEDRKDQRETTAAAAPWSPGAGAEWEQLPPESHCVRMMSRPLSQDQGVMREEAPGDVHPPQHCLQPTLPLRMGREAVVLGP